MFVQVLLPLCMFARALAYDAPEIVEAEISAQLEKRATFPFTRMVAFGDNLSDNGNGSFAHGVQDSNPQNTIYGYRTWTNGPVAVSYLSTYLNTPLTTDYAFGHANGGSLFGATIDNAYTKSTANAPSSKDQINTYLASPGVASTIGSTLHFLWIGANDINLYHINTNAQDNSAFGNAMASMMAAQVQTLVNAGAKYIVVPNLYPKNISPSSIFYTGDFWQLLTLQNAITGANTAIQNALAKFGSKVVYIDINTYMSSLWFYHAYYGFTHINGEFCDGYSQQDFQLCLVPGGHADQFYWVRCNRVGWAAETDLQRLNTSTRRRKFTISSRNIWRR
ncbi:hypothetical protein MRB53_039895 [Persea americana]|nr:hypothetical protein MRB53_039895 [Persea americana]